MKKISVEYVIKLALAAVALFLALNFGYVKMGFSKLLDVLQPVFIGIILALILSVPMDFFEYKLLKNIKKHRLRKTVALILAAVVLSGVLAIIFLLAVPAAVNGVKNLLTQVADENYWNNLKASGAFLNFIITQCQRLFNRFINSANDYMPALIELAQNVLKLLGNFLLGIGVAIMILANRDKLKYQMKRIIRRVFKKQRVLQIAEVTELAIDKFSRYLGGQIIEAVVLGFVCYIFMIILRLPYPALISLIIGFANLIPILGAYIGGGVAAIIIFAVSPSKALVFIVFDLILQQIEGWTTYPIIVGKYVGLNGFWIILSITVLGGLFGFWGVFLGVPVTAFLHDYIGALCAMPKPPDALAVSENKPPSVEEK